MPYEMQAGVEYSVMRDFKAYFEGYNQINPTVADPRLGTNFQERVNWLARQVPRGVKLIEFGCGEGVILNALAERCRLHPESCGVDLSENAVRKATARFPHLKFMPTHQGGSIPHPGGSFDLVVCSEVIEYVYDADAVFQEFARVLRSGGVLLITTSYHGFLKDLVLVMSGRAEHHFHDPRNGKIRHYSRASLAAMLRDHHFRVTWWGGMGRVPWLWKCMGVAAVKGRA